MFCAPFDWLFNAGFIIFKNCRWGFRENLSIISLKQILTLKCQNFEKKIVDYMMLLLLLYQVKEEDLRSLMFGDYMNPDAEEEERVYDEVRSLDDMYQIVEQCLEEYNNTHKSRMNLVIFRYRIYVFIHTYCLHHLFWKYCNFWICCYILDISTDF